MLGLTPPARPESPWVPLLLSLPLGLSPPNPRSGERSRGPSALDRKLSAPLTRRASSLTAWKAGCFLQSSSLKPNPCFQLQHERAPGPAFPRDPAACRSHGQGIFSVQCSKPAEPPAQRVGRDRNHLPCFTSLLPPIRRPEKPSGQRLFPGSGAGETQRTETGLSGEVGALGSDPWSCLA